MQNEEKFIVDLYIPRKCSATNRLITAKDTASVQIDVAEVSTTRRITSFRSTPMAKSLEKRRLSLWLDLSDLEVRLMPVLIVSSVTWISSASEDDHALLLAIMQSLISQRFQSPNYILYI